MFEFAGGRQNNRSKDRPDGFDVWMLEPDGSGERLHQDLSHRVGGRAPDVLEQPCQAQSGGFTSDRRQLVCYSPVGIVQFKNEFITAWHVWRKVTVTCFDSGHMRICVHRLAHRIGCRQPLSEPSRENSLRFLRKILKPNRKNRWTLCYYAKCLATRK